MFPNALYVASSSRSNENRPNNRCDSLLIQSTRTSNLCAVVGSNPGMKKLLIAPLPFESQFGFTLHLGISDKNFNPVAFGFGILLPGNACRVPSALSGSVGS